MRSSAGARGHFQFMPETARQYGLDDPDDFGASATAAARFYADLLREFDGDLASALAGYNWGSGNVRKRGLARAPAETRDYIAQITRRMGR